MSGRQPPERPTMEELRTPSGVRKELNFIEWLRAEVSGTDEYMEAMLENQRLVLMMMMQQMGSMSSDGAVAGDFPTANDGSPEGFNTSKRPVPRNELRNRATAPLDAIGIANRTIFENDLGPATFQVDGSIFGTTVRATDDVGSGDPVRIIAPGNIAEPINDVALSLLGLAGDIGVDTYERAETGENVEIFPGETETVLRVGVQGASWISSGTNDETYSLYQYYIDGDKLLDEPLKEPLGLYNTPYKFPNPLSVDREIRIEVTRTADASGSAEYYSKVDYYK